MGYNVEDYRRIKEEYATKYERARKIADIRRAQIHAEIPEVFELDRILAGTGLEIMDIISSAKDTEKAIRELQRRNDELLAKRGEYLVAAGYPADYSDVHYECEKCSDSGYVDIAMCECMKKALARAGYESSGLGALIGRQTFENFELGYYTGKDRIMTAKYVEALKNFAESFSKDTYANFIMLGASGLGKTHLSTAVAKEVIDRGFDVLYVSAVGMLNDFEQRRFGNSTSGTKTNDVSRYYDCDLLIIDDLGTEVVNKFTQSCFYEVVNTRLNMRKCTIINTNLTLTEIASTYTDRIYSRILGEYQPLQFNGVDIRKQKST